MNLAQIWLDVYYMGKMIAGEGAGLFGRDRTKVGMAIADCLMDRYDRGWWGKDIPQIITRPNGFHGYINVDLPPQWAIEIAINRRTRLMSSLPGEVFFMLDRNDMIRNNWLRFADRAIAVFKGPAGHELYFFRNWPETFEKEQ